MPRTLSTHHSNQSSVGFIPVIIATIAAIIGLVIADVTLFFQILAKNELFRGNDLLSYLDIRYWDGSKYGSAIFVSFSLSSKQRDRHHHARLICTGLPIVERLAPNTPSHAQTVGNGSSVAGMVPFVVIKLRR